MTTFSKITLVCPFCGTSMGDFEMMSYTIHSSTLYSDGLNVTDPWMKNIKALVVCPGCKEVFWRDDAHKDYNERCKEGELPMAGDLYDLPFALNETFKEELVDFYDRLLKSGFANTTDKKIYLRFRIWWGINDIIRNQQAIYKVVLELKKPKEILNYFRSCRKSNVLFNDSKIRFCDNLEKLIFIFKPEYEDEQLLLAEMYRELGKFNRAKAILDNYKGRKGRMYWKIKYAVRWRKKRVIQL